MGYYLQLYLIFSILSLIVSKEINKDIFKYAGDLNLNNVSDVFTFERFYWVKDDKIYPLKNFDIDGLNKAYYPKCCPPGFLYNFADYNCVRSNKLNIYESESFRVNLIKSGMNQCEAIVDYYPETNITDILDEKMTVTFQNLSIEFGKYCLDDTHLDGYKILRICFESDYCDNIKGYECVKKCCPDGEIYETIENETKCIKQPTYGFNIEAHQSRLLDVKASNKYAVYHYIRECSLEINENFTIETYKQDNYCIEFEKNQNNTTYNVYVCTLYFSFVEVASTVSCICLVATIIVLSVAYRPQKLFNLVIIFYCIALLTALICNIIIKLWSDAGHNNLTYLQLFGYYASFTWMNVLCFDIRNGLNKTGIRITETVFEKYKKFIFYNLYAWPLAGIIILYYYLENQYRFAVNYLGLDPKYTHRVFFVVPLAISILINITLFILTVREVLQVRQRIKNMKLLDEERKAKNRRILDENKKQIILIFKLFLLMGVQWSTEIITSFFKYKHIYSLYIFIKILDAFNTLQGLFVFLIFAFKWRFIKTFVKRIERQNSDGTISSTTSGISMTSVGSKS